MVIQDISAGLDILGKFAGLARGKSLEFTPAIIVEDDGRVRYGVEVVNDGEETVVLNALGFNGREAPVWIKAGEVVRQAVQPGPTEVVEMPIRLDPGESIAVVQHEPDCSKWIRGAARDTLRAYLCRT